MPSQICCGGLLITVWSLGLSGATTWDFPRLPCCLPSFGRCLSSGSLSALQKSSKQAAGTGSWKSWSQTMFHNDAIVMFNLRYPKKELLRRLITSYNILIILSPWHPVHQEFRHHIRCLCWFISRHFRRWDLWHAAITTRRASCRWRGPRRCHAASHLFIPSGNLT